MKPLPADLELAAAALAAYRVKVAERTLHHQWAMTAADYARLLDSARFDICFPIHVTEGRAA